MKDNQLVAHHVRNYMTRVCCDLQDDKDISTLQDRFNEDGPGVDLSENLSIFDKEIDIFQDELNELYNNILISVSKNEYTKKEGRTKLINFAHKWADLKMWK